MFFLIIKYTNVKSDTSHFSLYNKNGIIVYSLFVYCLCTRSVLCWRGGSEDAPLLSVWGHRQHHQQDGEQRAASQDPLQRGHLPGTAVLRHVRPAVQGRDGGEGETKNENLLVVRRKVNLHRNLYPLKINCYIS